MAVFLLMALVAVASSTKLPNIILFLTDDQDILLNSMLAMNNVEQIIGQMGTTFKNAFVNTPICCPSRSTILTGKFLHNTGVYNNSLAGHCSSVVWQKTHERFTIGSLLKQNGYITFYAGKYLNQYGNEDCGGTRHVPMGYDWWLGLKGNSKYYNYTLSINGTAENFKDEYLTDVMNDYASKFLNQRIISDTPFFMVLSTPAAHAPFTPPKRHEKAFPTMKALRTPSFNYTANEKHWLLQIPPLNLPSNVEILDSIQQHRLQTLLAVDDMVQDIILKIQSLKILNNTYIIFTSDNGYHIGQFSQPTDKRQPYETDIRVPLLIRGPNIVKNLMSELPVSTVDLAPTILDMANIPTPSYMDGTSFLKSIQNVNHLPSILIKERNILIEYFGEGTPKSVDKDCPWSYDPNLYECSSETWCKCIDSKNNTYACVRRLSDVTNFKFCQFQDDTKFVEAYDLQDDPYELYNIYQHMEKKDVENYQETLNKLLICKGRNCFL